MANRLVLTILAFVALSVAAKSQEIKSFLGNGLDYQYYENDDFERIYHGKYSYKDRFLSSYVYSIDISGSFRHDVRSGEWIAIKAIDMYSLTMTTKGNYVNGLKEGKWTYNVSCSENGNKEFVEHCMHFHNNVLVDKVEFDNLKGDLGSNGEFINKWNFVHRNVEYIAEFRKNVIERLIVRDYSDGKIIFKYDNSTILNQIQDSIMEFHTIGNEVYSLKSISELSGYYRKEIEYIKDFFNEICKQIRTIDDALNHVEKGRHPFVIKSPQLLSRLSETEFVAYEAKLKEVKRNDLIKSSDLQFSHENFEDALVGYLDANELFRTKDIDDKIAQTRMEIERSNQIYIGDKLLEEKKFKEALEMYYKSYNMKKTEKLLETITNTNEAFRIDSLHKLRIDRYAGFLKKRQLLLNDRVLLSEALNSKYKNGYNICFDFFEEDMSIEIKLISDFLSNSSNFVITEVWTEEDTRILDALILLERKFEKCKSFHEKISIANLNKNKEILNKLKESSSAYEIIQNI